MPKITIGALVGMGPNSTGPFYDSVMQYARELYGAKYDIDFPKMIMISLPTPFYVDRPVDDGAMIASLLEGIEDLKRLRVDFIAVPCNVVHRYYEVLARAASPIPILHMIDLAVEKVPSAMTENIALIATVSTAQAGIYQQRLAERKLTSFHNSVLQEHVTSLLKELKVNNLSSEARQLWVRIIQYLKENKCQVAILACTDIAPCLKLDCAGIVFVDSGSILARNTIEEYMRLANIPSVGDSQARSTHLQCRA